MDLGVSGLGQRQPDRSIEPGYDKHPDGPRPTGARPRCQYHRGGARPKCSHKDAEIGWLARYDSCERKRAKQGLVAGCWEAVACLIERPRPPSPPFARTPKERENNQEGKQTKNQAQPSQPFLVLLTASFYIPSFLFCYQSNHTAPGLFRAVCSTSVY